MAEVLFYHLTRTPLEATLPDLLQRSLTRGWRAVVRCGSAERMAWLDERLWTVDEAGFLPHGQAGGAHDAAQPVLLTTGPGAANGADVLFAVDGATVEADEAGTFTRCCLIFDGNHPATLKAARADWKRLTDAGLPARYWSQESGSWQEKASRNV
jgi:DNA polymerase-3 subunit chi